MTAVELIGVAKSYGRTAVLDDVSLSVAEHGLTAILGPSGSGKTTLLRLIAGFERADRGVITIGDRVVDDQSHHLRPERRGVGYVPQDGALFPHLTAAANVGFGVRDGSRERVGELLRLVGLAGLGQRYPHELSGGQQQRVALARAMAIRPKLLLLDEPFSSLDASLRSSLRRDVSRLLAETGTPALIVTHDQDEALSMADQVVILEAGRILAQGTPSELYDEPSGSAAARYLGLANLLSAVMQGGRATCVFGVLALREPIPVDGPGIALVRPEQLVLDPDPAAAGTTAVVTSVEFHGHDSVVEAELADGTPVTARLVGTPGLRVGASVKVRVAGDVLGWAESGSSGDRRQVVEPRRT